MKLWIFTEGDQLRGLGHLSRCSSYAAAWQNLGGIVQWVIDGDSTAKRFMNQSNVIWKKWQHGNIIVPSNKNIAIVDSYTVSLEQLEYLSSLFNIISYLDDTFRLPYPKGIVVHPASTSTQITKSSCCWLTGPTWQSIRPAFIKTIKEKAVVGTIKNILIMMGGTDIRNITSLVISIVRKVYPSARLHVITNIALDNANNCTYYSNLSANQVADLMRKNDISICAAGQTIFELIACLLPSIIIKTAENQSIQLKQVSSKDLFPVIEEWSHDNLKEKISFYLSLLDSYDERSKYVYKMKNYGVSDGASRFANLLFYYSKISDVIAYGCLKLVPFTMLSKAEKIKILSIRNRIKVRCQMMNTKRISISSHFRFISTQINNPLNINYAVFYGDVIIGSTSLHKIDWVYKEAWLDIYRHPSHNWSGFGNKILLAAKHVAFDIAHLNKLNLCVKNNNKSALDLYRKHGFIQVCSENDIVKMTLCKESYQQNEKY
ncbi:MULTISPECIES: GNAT family N-acetyltransferase [Aeromonas]|uniref:GNAT family N-acetyltransferase n=1 Tax=Aeromonas TaxID=642 RepID=UPI0022E30EF4|nr:MULTISPECIES: GNAT family N-acetyltransferase [Aeromonas]